MAKEKSNKKLKNEALSERVNEFEEETPPF